MTSASVRSGRRDLRVWGAVARVWGARSAEPARATRCDRRFPTAATGLVGVEARAPPPAARASKGATRASRTRDALAKVLILESAVLARCEPAGVRGEEWV